MRETQGAQERDVAAEPVAAEPGETAPGVVEPADLLVAMVDLTPPGPTLTLSTGHTATVAPNEPDRLTIRGPAGEVELSIRFTPEGPVLRFASAAIDLQSQGDIRIDCGRLEVRAREGIDLTTHGDLRQTAGKVEIDATDDVDIQGRRVLLNS